MSFTNRFALFFVLAALACTAPLPLAATGLQTSPAQASKFVEDLGTRYSTLLANSDGSDPIQLQAEIQKFINESFDLNLIGRAALGPTWQTATADQRREYQKLFAVWMTENYTRRLGAGGHGWSLDAVGARPGSESADAIVETRITRRDGKSVTVDLHVRESGDRMRIVDVTMGGVSLGVVQRAEFASVVRHKGLDGLIARLRTGIDDLVVKTASETN
jgi:phospholipid transport system substrate-binding protein